MQTINKLLTTFVAGCIFFISCNNEKTEANEMTSPNDDSLKQLNEAIKNYPDSLPLVEKLIGYYRDKNSYDTAIAITDEALKKDSDNAELWDIEATLHFENDDTTGAIKAFESAINIYPLPEYLISLGTLYAQTKNSKALQVADALLSSNKARAEKEALFIKGLYYTYTNNKNKSITFFDSCIHLDYTYMFAYREKAIALYDENNFNEALDVLERAVKLQNNFDEGYYWMGMCYEKLNRPQDAIESYQTALMYDKDFIEAQSALARLTTK